MHEEQSDSGEWVYFNDHAAIVAAFQELVLELAAEAGRMKKAIKQVFPLGVDEEKGKIGFSGIAKECYASALKTPATDSFIREIQEQAVEGFSEFCGDNSVFIQETCNYDSLADAASIYLARISEGEHP